MYFNNTENELKNEIKKLEEKNQCLESKLKENNKSLENVLKLNKLNKFYSDVIFEFSNKRFYSDVLNDIYEFCKNNKDNFSLTNELLNHIKGKIGELAVLKELIGKNSYKSMEYFYDINIGNINKSNQVDFLSISPNAIHIIEVKNWDLESLELVSDENGHKTLNALYKSGERFDIKIKKIKKRCQSVNNILKKFDKKLQIPIYNIIVFINDIPSIKGDIKKEKILKKNIPEDSNYYYPIYDIKMDDKSEMKLQLLTQKGIGNYLERFIPSKENSTKYDLKKLDTLTKFFKSDINFIDSTDPIYIIKSIQEFFDSVYKKIENEKLENNKNINLIFDKSYDNKKK